MKAFFQIVTLTLSLVTGGILLAGSFYDISTTEDWHTEAVLAKRAGVPVMMVFSADECPYCQRLKKQVLLPLVKNGKLSNKVLLREFNIDHGGKIVDFDGERIRTRIFVQRYDIYATPTVVLVDYEGEPLATPIVGFNEPDAYTDQLRDTIDSATMTLAALRGPRFSAVDGTPPAHSHK
ncbi:MAG: thioredoxin fold domain-containing protein [Gammaproteobacteria bacterium]|nr:thioredoxin fold domain-containing protein [Gammaproteobacteria bacterium]